MIYFAMPDFIVWYDSWGSLDIVTNNNPFRAQKSIKKKNILLNLFDNSEVYSKYFILYVYYMCTHKKTDTFLQLRL